jgi:hypothetical protein
MLAIDVSNYSSDFTPENLAALKDAGVGLVIVQSIDPPAGYPAGKTRAQIEACLAAGLAVDGYVYLWFDLGVDDMKRKLALLDGLPIRQLWLDVEDESAARYSQADCEAKVAAALAECDAFPTTGGQPTGIYTGAWYWQPRTYMGNTTAFSDRKLWDAHYDTVADASVGFVPYGGWESCRIKQFAGSSELAGITGVDLDALSAEEAAELEAGMPDVDEGWQAKKGDVVRLAGELVAVADQIEASAMRKGGPIRGQVLPLAGEVRKRAQEILT